MQELDEMASAAEIIERLARENERQLIEIDALKKRIADLEKLLADKG